MPWLDWPPIVGAAIVVAKVAAIVAASRRPSSKQLAVLGAIVAWRSPDPGIKATFSGCACGCGNLAVSLASGWSHSAVAIVKGLPPEVVARLLDNTAAEMIAGRPADLATSFEIREPIFRFDRDEPLCEGRGCHLCEGGFVATGMTAGQAERLAEAATRLDIRADDIVVVRDTSTDRLLMFVVSSIEGGKAFGCYDTLHRKFMAAPVDACRRVGRIDRKEGEPI